MAGPTAANRRGIFISYRRADSKPWTGRLANDLRAYYGRDRVYLDLDSTRAAQDYRHQIDEALGLARVAIAVIGPRWLAEQDQGGVRRIDNPDDVVRCELESALSSGIALATVLVGGATVPPADQLPGSLRAISTIHANRMSDEDWEYDLGRLLESFERHGLFASLVEPSAPMGDWQPTTHRSYERTVKATRRRALDAVIGTVEALGYKDRRVLPEAAQVSFRATGRTIAAKVVDAKAGYSKVVVEYPTLKAGVAAAGTLLLATGGPLGLVAWPALRAWERRFAKGFLDNVQRVLEGRGIGEDSAVPRGVSDWLNRSREV
jgi:hypothetical protein